MAAGNQTRLSFVQQKAGSRRILESKRAKAVSTTDTDANGKAAVESVASLPSPEKQSQKKAKAVSTTTDTDANSQTVLESVASLPSPEKQPQKKAKAVSTTNTDANGQVAVEGFASLPSPQTRLQKKSKAVPTTNTDANSEAAVESVASLSSPQTRLQKKSKAVSTTDTDASREVAVESVASLSFSQEQLQEKPDTQTQTMDDDDIHPLARTVVKVAPRTYPRKVHEEATNDSKHKVQSRTPISTLSPVIIPKTIVQEPVNDTPLPLPSHLSMLFANFKALESVLLFTKRQGQLTFYHKVKKHVELQSSRNFEIKHLAQFKTLLPEGYKFTAAPCLFEGVKTRSILIEMLELKDDYEGKFIPQADRRRKLFVERLYDHIKKHHQTFLTSTTPPRTDTYPHEWHPDFDLESVPQIEEAEVPLLKPAVIDASNLDLRSLGSRRESLRRSSKEEPSSTTSSADVKKSATATQVAKVVPESPAVKALSSLEQLKERIRQKQLERKESGRGLATPEERRQALASSRLPSVFDLIRFKRVDVVSLKTLTEQVVKSSRLPISDVEGKECLEMLAEALPEWCNVFSLNDGSRYFKVLKDDGQGGKIKHDEKALRARLVAKSIGKLA
ncbi:hypothetical protein BGZ65_011470 [Modicella reniformis]|uniref:CDT1 Geminin-binding domain-containing protein n=1 Tax=Modicella reniformis TaxID=1440133 RepID=A0A9P6M1I5_9FUNG|nr:hypothetical protein BGZ65_011470 [Modicella reniformis]